MSNQARAYSAYLENWTVTHGEIVQPAYVSMFAPEGQEIAALFSESSDEVASVVFQKNGAKDARIAADGRAIEKWHDTRGCALYAVFPSADDLRAYAKPSSSRELYEQW